MFSKVTYFSVDINNELSKQKCLEVPSENKTKTNTNKQTKKPNQQLHYSESYSTKY